MFRLICPVIGYLAGCIQTAYITGKLASNIDIREHGSGNAGFTNVNRVLGARLGLLVFWIDVFKAVAVFMLCACIFNGSSAFFTGGEFGLLPGLYGGIGVILGHNFPVFLKFKGGKGVASSLGIILCLHLPSALVIFISGIVTVAVTRFISAASLLMLLMLPIFLLCLGQPVEVVILAALMTAMTYYQHRANIVRLFNGSERKFSFSAKK